LRTRDGCAGLAGAPTITAGRVITTPPLFGPDDDGDPLRLGAGLERVGVGVRGRGTPPAAGPPLAPLDGSLRIACGIGFGCDGRESRGTGGGCADGRAIVGFFPVCMRLPGRPRPGGIGTAPERSRGLSIAGIF
jgi:hypothetical protein